MGGPRRRNQFLLPCRGRRLSRFLGKAAALSLCRFERAVLRAEAAAGSFAPSDGACLDDPACVLRSGRHAALVHLFTEPDRLLAALEGESALPPLSTTECPIVVAPGLPGL